MKSLTPHQINNHIMRNTKPSLAYDGTLPFSEWQKVAKRKLWELLGMDKFQKCDSNFTIEYTKEHENATEIRFKFQSEENYYIPCHLMIPKGKECKLPVVICLQGHSTGMHISLGRTKFPSDAGSISSGDRDFANRILQEGYIALVMEQRNFGECGALEDGTTDCYNSSMAAILIGRTTIGERVWDISNAIDVLEEEFSDIYNGYCICMGNSGGGTATFYASCLEDRINASMPSCAVCSFDDSIGAMRHCTCNFVPHIREYFDMGDLGGLIAPKKCVVVSGLEDDGFPIDGAVKSFKTMQELYTLAGCENSVRHVIGNKGHRFYADDSWPVMNELIKNELP